MKSLQLHTGGGVGRLLTVSSATTLRERLRGLLGHAPLHDGQAMLLRPCRLVHTFGMTFAIDIVFLDRAGVVCRIDEAVPRRRMRGCTSAWQTLEMAAGAARLHGLRRGQMLARLDKDSPP